MKTKLPTTTVTFSKTLKETTFDFDVTFNIFGEVLEVKNYFLQLPKTAQQLMLGRQADDIDTYLKAHIQLFSLTVPLIAAGYVEKEFKEKSWAKFSEAIREMRKAHPDFKKISPIKSVEKPWVKKIWGWKLSFEEARELFQIAELAIKRAEMRSSNFDNLLLIDGYIEELSWILFNISNCEVQLEKSQKNRRYRWRTPIPHIYTLIKQFPHKKYYDVLLENLQKEAYEKSHYEIIEALGKYDNPELRTIFLQLLQKKVNTDLLSYILVALQKYPDKEVKNIMFSYLTSENVGMFAYNNLVYFGVTEQEIAAHIFPLFKMGVETSKLLHAMRIYEKMHMHSIPSFKYMKIMIEMHWKKSHHSIPTNLLGKYPLEETVAWLQEMLRHEHINVKRQAMAEYGRLAKKKDIYYVIEILNKETDVYFPPPKPNTPRRYRYDGFPNVLTILENKIHSFSFSPPDLILPLLELSRKCHIDNDKKIIFRIISRKLSKKATREESILEYIKDEFNDKMSDSLRRILISILGKLPNKAGLGMLVNMVQDPSSSGVLSILIPAISKLSYQDYLKIFKNLALSANEIPQYSWRAILSELKPALELNPILYKMLKETNGAIKVKIMEKLYPTPENNIHLYSLINDSNHNVRILAKKLLQINIDEQDIESLLALESGGNLIRSISVLMKYDYISHSVFFERLLDDLILFNNRVYFSIIKKFRVDTIMFQQIKRELEKPKIFRKFIIVRYLFDNQHPRTKEIFASLLEDDCTYIRNQAVAYMKQVEKSQKKDSD